MYYVFAGGILTNFYDSSMTESYFYNQRCKNTTKITFQLDLDFSSHMGEQNHISDTWAIC
jgi:hypothetical protein